MIYYLINFKVFGIVLLIISETLYSWFLEFLYFGKVIYFYVFFFMFNDGFGF